MGTVQYHRNVLYCTLALAGGAPGVFACKLVGVCLHAFPAKKSSTHYSIIDAPSLWCIFLDNVCVCECECSV